MTKFVPLRVRTHIGSLLGSVSRPSDIVSRCLELDYPACAVVDSTLGGVIQFTQALNKKKLKSIKGIQFNICDEPAHIKKHNVNKYTITLLAKNLVGWKSIINAVTEANRKFYYEPRLSLEELAAIIGSNCVVFTDRNIDTTKALFGKENVFIGIDNNKYLRDLGSSTQTSCIATPDVRYCKQEDAADLRLVLAVEMKSTLNQINKDIQKGKRVDHEEFFKSNDYYMKGVDELGFYTEEELKNTLLVNDMCEDYNIFSKPDMPNFPCPNGLDNNTYFRQLCYEGRDRLKLDNPTYNERMQYELGVLEKFDLTGYFLVVHDFVTWGKNQGYYLGPSRGCLHKNSPILTEFGYKDIYQITKGDKVYSRDGKLHSVKNLFKYKCDETLLKINTYYGDRHGLTVTKDHKILGQKKKYTKLYEKTRNDSYKRYESVTNELDWFEAKDLKHNDWVFVPYTDIIDKSNIVFDLTKYSREHCGYDDDQVYYYHYNKLCGVVNATYTCRRFLEFDSELAYIFGLFIGDGWVTKNDERNCVGFAFNSTERDAMYFVLEYFERLGCIARVLKHKTKKLYQLVINNYYIKELFKDLWNEYRFKSETKYIPQLLKDSNKNNLVHIMRGIIESDGNLAQSKNGTKITISSTSKRLAYDIKELCFKLSKVCTLAFSDRTDKRKDRKKKKWREYRINVQVCDDFVGIIQTANQRYKAIKDGFLVQIQKIEEVENDHKFVYDIEVEGEHNYLTSSGIVHNSAGGCLVSYLTGITRLDPIPHGLIFERFYNEGRNTEDHIALPDIDIDFPKGAREHIVEYIEEKYGKERVGPILTYQRMKGKGAMKEVLRVHEACPFDEMNLITKDIPDEAKISDKLQEMRDEGRDSSIILWALENLPKSFQQWAYLEDDVLKGDYSRYFAQAIRLEGINKSKSQHASGLVIGNRPLTEYCPIIQTKSGEYSCGWEMGDLEAVGLTKFDLLGVVTLNKMVLVKEML